MNIVMMTNTYKPIVGGIERSIEVFSSRYRAEGHKVLIVSPVFKDMPEEEEGVFRIPAIQNFNGTDFSVELPVPGILKGVLDEFNPDIVHSHHPFLVGDTALRVSAAYNIPIVFTYHTMYEMNTHYVPGDSDLLKKFVIELAAGYSNLCDQVVAPSKSIKELLRERGVKTKVITIPTGIDIKEFKQGDKRSLRQRLGITDSTFLLGYLGRIAEEKNMHFLTDAVFGFLAKNKDAHFLVVGEGDLEGELKEKAEKRNLKEQIHFTGTLKGQDKINAYHAMDVFVFASKSETQGLVLAEAMVSGVPVVGLDAPGAREIIKDEINGYLLPVSDTIEYEKVLEKFYTMNNSEKDSFVREAKATADEFDYERSVRKTLAMYKEVISRKRESKDSYNNIWFDAKRSIKKEIEIILNVLTSTGKALKMKRNGDGNEAR